MAIVLALILVGLASPLLFTTAKWVGHTDLEVRFRVSDAVTGSSLPNAVVHIRAEGRGFCHDCGEPEFTLKADEQGIASHVCKGCMCFGSRGLFEDTYGVHLPPWWYHVEASGFITSEPAYLDISENSRRAERGKPYATIVVPVRLQPALE